MKLTKAYKPAEAVPLMGIPCAKSSADRYISNMFRDGMLRTSYKLNHRWCISEEDIIYIRSRIIAGEYKPNAKFREAA